MMGRSIGLDYTSVQDLNILWDPSGFSNRLEKRHDQGRAEMTRNCIFAERDVGEDRLSRRVYAGH